MPRYEPPSLDRRRALRALSAAAASVVLGLANRPALAQPSSAAGRDGTHVVAPGASIQAAVDAAPPGGTVAVEPGSWTETVTIDKPLTLVGIGGYRQTVLAADRDAFRWSGLPRERYRVGAVNVVDTQDVVVQGLTFLDALEGVWISASRRVTVVDCMSCAHTSSGYYVWGSQDVTIARCIGEDNAVGIYQGGSVDVSIVDSLFTRNVGGVIPHLDDQAYPGTGILLGNFSRGGRIVGNDASGNADWGLGVSLGVTEIVVRGNRMADNLVGIFAGARGVRAHRNDIVGNAQFGVEAAAGCDARWNWWGDASGPSGAGPGQGDAVTPTVAIEPWLRAPTEESHGVPSGA